MVCLVLHLTICGALRAIRDERVMNFAPGAKFICSWGIIVLFPLKLRNAIRGKASDLEK